MPSAIMDGQGIDSVGVFSSFLSNLLSRAESVKQTASLEPPLDKSDFEDLQGQLSEMLGHFASPTEETTDTKKTHQFAILETAVRDTFSNLIVSPGCNGRSWH